jgi:hypothetical protein
VGPPACVGLSGQALAAAPSEPHALAWLLAEPWVLLVGVLGALATDPAGGATALKLQLAPCTRPRRWRSCRASWRPPPAPGRSCRACWQPARRRRARSGGSSPRQRPASPGGRALLAGARSSATAPLCAALRDRLGRERPKRPHQPTHAPRPTTTATPTPRRLRAQAGASASQLAEALAALDSERGAAAAAAAELRAQLRRTEASSSQLGFELSQARGDLQFEAAEKARYWNERKDKQEEINKLMVRAPPFGGGRGSAPWLRPALAQTQA